MGRFILSTSPHEAIQFQCLLMAISLSVLNCFVCRKSANRLMVKVSGPCPAALARVSMAALLSGVCSLEGGVPHLTVPHARTPPQHSHAGSPSLRALKKPRVGDQSVVFGRARPSFFHSPDRSRFCSYQNSKLLLDISFKAF